MTTVSLHSEGDTTLDQFDSFMADLLWEKEVNISLSIVVTISSRAVNEVFTIVETTLPTHQL